MLGAIRTGLTAAGMQPGGELPSFYITLRTTTANQVETIPTKDVGLFSATIDWGDGSPIANVTAYNDANLTHEYAVAGDYTVTIVGRFPNIFYDNGIYAPSVIAFDGNDYPFLSFDDGLHNCINLVTFVPFDGSAVSDFQDAWRSCDILPSFPLIDVSNGTSFKGTWYSCAGFTSFPLLDVSNGIEFSDTWRGCEGLTSFPLLDTSKGQNFYRAWRYCRDLVDFPAGFFDNWNPASVSTNCFFEAWVTCNVLSLTSIQNILVSLAASGVSAPASGTDITLEGAPTLATVQSDGTISTAVTTLKSRGWTPTYDGTSL
jgi:hypothetical protein